MERAASPQTNGPWTHVPLAPRQARHKRSRLGSKPRYLSKVIKNPEKQESAGQRIFKGLIADLQRENPPSHYWKSGANTNGRFAHDKPRRPCVTGQSQEVTGCGAPGKEESSWQQAWREVWGKLLYNYYNWRQDTVCDLQLIVFFNIGVVLLGTLLRGLLWDDQVQDVGQWLSNLYQVITLSFGENFPDANAPFTDKLFSVMVATCGLASFAMVLALVEQVVLEMLDANVKRGSVVYEKDHLLILSWCKSQRDVEMVRKVLEQYCLAHKPTGGTTIVVMTQRQKLEMEALLWRCLPAAKRFGTKIVIRQGSPLIPSDLKMVAACQAASTIIVSDHSRSPTEADAQSVRCAILLDEQQSQCGAPVSNHLETRHVVVDVKTSNAMPLLKYACSSRVLALPTNQLNALRLAKMVKRPVISVVSQQLFNFANSSSLYVQQFPQVVGTQFGDLARMFPDAIVLGVVHSNNRKATMNPKADYVVIQGDELILIRPTDKSGPQYQPLMEPIPFHLLNQSWDTINPEPTLLAAEQEATRGSQPHKPGCLKAVTMRSCTCNPSSLRKQEANTVQSYMIPPEYLNVDFTAEKVLLCGWADHAFMLDLLRELDHGQSCLPHGSEVVCVNVHDPDESLGKVVRSLTLENVTVRHVQLDPLQRSQMTKLDLSSFRCAIVLCDELWVDPDNDDSNGIDTIDEPSVLRLDALVMVVQLNIRKILEDQQLPPLNIIGQKVANEGLTRFEDRHRLPLGISVNFSSFAAKMLTQVAYNRKMLLPCAQLGEGADITIVDASAYAEVGERLNFWELISRAQVHDELLVGYYAIPEELDEPLESIINPVGVEARCQRRVWNTGNGMLKFIIIRNKMSSPGAGSPSSSSFDDLHIEYRLTQRAHWVASSAEEEGREEAELARSVMAL